MADLKERVCIEFCFLLGKTAAELSQCFERLLKKKLWARQGFTNGFLGSNVVTSLEDQPRSGRPSTSRTNENIQKICDAIMFDRHRTINDLEALTGVSWSSCQWILTEELWRSVEWLLHHDNAPTHTALSVRQFLTKNRMTSASHPPYSLDLAPCDFFLFPRMKRDLKGKRFQNVEEVRGKKDGGTEDYHFARVPELFWTMEKAMG